MGKRITVVMADDIHGKLTSLQGKAIERSSQSISFSDVVSMGINYALTKGYNVSEIVRQKESKKR